jgi:predicted enzyme related to lactoylglutathione lyase
MSGVLIFTRDPESLSRFYGSLLETSSQTHDDGTFTITTPNLKIVFHQMYIEKSATSATKIHEPREDVATKLILEVSDIEVALSRVVRKGGWLTGRYFNEGRRSGEDVVDPDGNVVHLTATV